MEIIQDPDTSNSSGNENKVDMEALERFFSARWDALKNPKIPFDTLKALDGKVVKFTYEKDGRSFVGKVETEEEPHPSEKDAILQKAKIIEMLPNGEAGTVHYLEGWAGRTDTSLADFLARIDSAEEAA